MNTKYIAFQIKVYTKKEYEFVFQYEPITKALPTVELARAEAYENTWDDDWLVFKAEDGVFTEIVDQKWKDEEIKQELEKVNSEFKHLL